MAEKDKESIDSGDSRHWVEQLFPPAFGFTVDELLADIDHKPAPEKSFFDKLADRVHPQDTTAIKNVYHRVWLMTQIEQQEKQDKAKIKKQAETVTKGRKTLQVCDADTSTSDLLPTPQPDIEDECIWSSSEIRVLREVFAAAREQNQQLKASLADTEDRLHRLEELRRAENGCLQLQGGELSEATKSNTRLQILTHNLNHQLKTLQQQVSSQKSELVNLKSERTKVMQECHELKVKYNRERLERTTVTHDLERQTKDALHQQMLREERAKLSQDRELGALHQKMTSLQTELVEERKSHERTKRGLDHLRTHFSSLPLSGEVDNGTVIQDQLKTWTY